MPPPPARPAGARLPGPQQRAGEDRGERVPASCGPRARPGPPPRGAAAGRCGPYGGRSRLHSVSPCRIKTHRWLVIRTAEHSEQRGRNRVGPHDRPAGLAGHPPAPDRPTRGMARASGVDKTVTARTNEEWDDNAHHEQGTEERQATRAARPGDGPRAERRRRPAGALPGRRPQPELGRRQPWAFSSATWICTRCPTTRRRPSWPSGWRRATTRPAGRWWRPTSAWSSTGPGATRTEASTCPTSSRRAPSGSCGPWTSSTGSGASGSPPMPPGGSARPCSGPSSSTAGPSGCPWR